ncbi:hypothetical protein C8R47DRAFT_1215626 [Mycena vitilis]|nr:hypothetical protein C8R47DRAFT_1215626 [Mycena vitilis]
MDSSPLRDGIADSAVCIHARESASSLSNSSGRRLRPGTARELLLPLAMHFALQAPDTLRNAIPDPASCDRTHGHRAVEEPRTKKCRRSAGLRAGGIPALLNLNASPLTPEAEQSLKALSLTSRRTWILAPPTASWYRQISAW